MIQANPFLYDKTDKYANADFKVEVWTQIGASLIHPLEGPVAEKKFYALRQRFGKEQRKVTQSMLRSGAEANQPTYTPTWVLYKDFIFLEDIIKSSEENPDESSTDVSFRSVFFRHLQHHLLRHLLQLFQSPGTLVQLQRCSKLYPTLALSARCPHLILLQPRKEKRHTLSISV